MTELPELQGLLIVPLWKIPQDRIATANVAHNDGKTVGMVTAMRSIEACVNIIQQMDSVIAEHAKQADDTLKALAQELHVKSQQYDELNQKLSKADRAPDRQTTAGQAAPAATDDGAGKAGSGD